MIAGAPSGFVYRENVVTEAEERELVAHLGAMEFFAVEMRGQVARRRTAHFGWVYGYESWKISPGPAIPAFFSALRGRAASLAGVAPDDLAEVLVTEYAPGAGIGWHRDAPQFGDVVGVSLLSDCTMRFQRGKDDARETRAAPLARRSAYVLTGEARHDWQHTISPMKTLRYSITFRTLRASR